MVFEINPNHFFLWLYIIFRILNLVCRLYPIVSLAIPRSSAAFLKMRLSPLSLLEIAIYLARQVNFIIRYSAMWLEIYPFWYLLNWLCYRYSTSIPCWRRLVRKYPRFYFRWTRLVLGKRLRRLFYRQQKRRCRNSVRRILKLK